MVISSPVTPGAVAPPLSPVYGAKQGWAKKSGTASLPVEVSHRLPQSIDCGRPCSVAWANDIGYVSGAGAVVPAVVVSGPGVVAPVDATDVSGAAVVVVVVVAGDTAVVVALESPPESRVASRIPPP